MPSAATTSGAMPMPPSKAGATDGSFSSVLSNAKHSRSTNTLLDSVSDANQEDSARPDPEAFPHREYLVTEREDDVSGTGREAASSDPNGVSAATSDPDVTATNNARVSSLFPNVPVLPSNLLQQAISSLDSSGPETLKSNIDTGKSEPAKVLSTNAEERDEASQTRSSSFEGTSALYLVVPQQLDQAHAAISGGDYQGSGGRASVVHSSKYDSSLYRNQLPALPDSSATTASARGAHRLETTTRETDQPGSKAEDDSSFTVPPSVSMAPMSVPIDSAPQDNAVTPPSVSVNETNGPQIGESLEKRNLNFSLAGEAAISNATGSANVGPAPSTAGATTAASSQMISAASQPGQHAPVTSIPSDTGTQKASGGSVIDGQPVLIRTSGHDTDSQQKASVPTTPPALRSDRDGSSFEVKDAGGMNGVNTAKLVQTMNETEMHVGMHSSEFGDISIRASISQQQMTAQISLDHGDLREAILAHVSSMQAKLGNDYGMQASIAVHQQGASSSGGSGHSSQQEDRGSNRSMRPADTARVAEPDMNIRPAPILGTLDGPRLDIQA